MGKTGSEEAMRDKKTKTIKMMTYSRNKTNLIVFQYSDPYKESSIRAGVCATIHCTPMS